MAVDVDEITFDGYNSGVIPVAQSIPQYINPISNVRISSKRRTNKYKLKISHKTKKINLANFRLFDGEHSNNFALSQYSNSEISNKPCDDLLMNIYGGAGCNNADEEDEDNNISLEIDSEPPNNS